MKKLKQLSLVILVLTFILSACTMEKRVYLPGYSVSWSGGVNKKEKQQLVKNNVNKKVITENKNTVAKTEAIEKQKQPINQQPHQMTG